MAWQATETFEGLNVADLAGQGGGSGWTGNWTNAATEVINVSSATTFDGSRSADVNTNAGSTLYYRVIATPVATDGNVFYIAMRRSGISAGGDLNVLLRSGTTNRFNFGLKGDQNLKIAGTTTVTLLSTYSFNTWYTLRITLNAASNTMTAAYGAGNYLTGFSYSSESSAVTGSNSGDIDRIYINCDPDSGSEFIDYISPTDPSGVYITKAESAGTPTESLSVAFSLSASETAGTPTESANAGYGFANPSKSSSTWTNTQKS